MNEQRFTGLAALYAAHRPAYPDALAEFLYTEVFRTASCTIADIGAGTGIFSELLLARGSSVFAVEPNDDMMRQAQAKLGHIPAFTPVAAGAEDTTLAPQSVDYVTAAQAFHWFDLIRFRAECNRILRPDGKVVLVWNSRISTHPLIAENARILYEFCPEFSGFSGGMEDQTPDLFASFFRGGAYETKCFPNPIVYDEAGFVGRNLSSSYAPRETDVCYQPFVDAVQVLFRRFSQNGLLEFPMETRCYTGEV